MACTGFARTGALGALLGAALWLAPSTATGQTAPDKFFRGMAAVGLAPLEVPGNVLQMSRRRGPGWGTTLGFLEGIGRVPVRVGVGVYEIVTAPFPVPPHYQPIIEPEYPWQYFE
jgi:putative exosortase-associated protein (TIGR04073 family)